MPNYEQIQGHWHELKGRLKEHWGQLTDNDFAQAEGSVDRLVGVVEQKTGAARHEIERLVDNVFQGSIGERTSEAVQHYSDKAQRLANDASEYARAQAHRLSQQSEECSARVIKTVRSRPIESMAVAFGLGIAAGAFFLIGRNR